MFFVMPHLVSFVNLNVKGNTSFLVKLNQYVFIISVGLSNCCLDWLYSVSLCCLCNCDYMKIFILIIKWSYIIEFIFIDFVQIDFFIYNKHFLHLNVRLIFDYIHIASLKLNMHIFYFARFSFFFINPNIIRKV